MADDFLAGLLGNQNRARVVRLFVLNQSQAFTVAQIAKRVGVSASAAKKEIRVLEQLDILKKGKLSITLANGTKRKIKGKQKELSWTLNPDFKYARALALFIHEIAPVQHKNILNLLRSSGRLAVVILSGSFMGDSTRPADIIVVGDSLHEKRLEATIKALEPRFGQEIRYAAFSTPEFRYRLTIQDRLIRDTVDYPHVVLLDRERLLRAST